jgi:heat shock protein HtpX
MNAWKLRISMAGTLAIIFGLSTLVFAVILTVAGIGFTLVDIGILVVALNIGQWLLAPYLIGWIYKVKELRQDEKPELHQIVSDISRKSGIATPKLMLANIPLPNAFAYGSPLSGTRVAVTQGLLDSLDKGEVEAVLGHELGHVKHHDVQVMMVASFLPALFYYIGYSLMLSGVFGGGNKKNGGGNNALIGIAFMAFSWILTLFTLYLSRLREYYADRHSVSVVDNGATKLSTGLAKIVHASAKTSKSQQQKQQTKTMNGFKSLFIANPETAQEDSAAVNAFENNQQLVDNLLAKKITFGDKLIEALSTHPNIVKRLRALQELNTNPRNY